MDLISDYCEPFHLMTELSGAYADLVKHSIANRWRHRDPHYASWYIEQGSLNLESEDFTSVIEAGTWVFLDPIYERTQIFSADARIISVRLNVEWHGLHTLGAPRPPFVVRSDKTAPLIETSTALIKPVSDRHTGTPLTPERYHEVMGLFHRWVGLWLSVRAAHGRPLPLTPDHEPRLLQLIHILEESSLTGPAPYALMEKQVTLSRSQINRIFMEKLGMTPQQWRERKLQGRVEKLLKRPDLSLKQITHQLGFVDSSHFAKWFKKRYQMAPSTYRLRGFQSGA